MAKGVLGFTLVAYLAIFGASTTLEIRDLPSNIDSSLFNPDGEPANDDRAAGTRPAGAADTNLVGAANTNLAAAANTNIPATSTSIPNPKVPACDPKYRNSWDGSQDTSPVACTCPNFPCKDFAAQQICLATVGGSSPYRKLLAEALLSFDTLNTDTKVPE